MLEINRDSNTRGSAIKRRRFQCIVIPAHNEAKTIGDVVARCRSLKDFCIIVVDDQSTDETRIQAERHGATVLSLPVRLGAWGATQTGLRFAAHQGCQLAVTLDGDGQHDPMDVPRLVAPVLQGTADLVIGSCPQRGSLARRTAWAFFRRLADLQIQDLTSGFRALNGKAIQLLVSEKATLLDYQDLGVLMLARHEGLRIAEVSVSMKSRPNGVSRVFRNWGVVCWYLIYSGLLSLSKRPYFSSGRAD